MPDRLLRDLPSTKCSRPFTIHIDTEYVKIHAFSTFAEIKGLSNHVLDIDADISFFLVVALVNIPASSSARGDYFINGLPNRAPKYVGISFEVLEHNIQLKIIGRKEILAGKYVRGFRDNIRRFNVRQFLVGTDGAYEFFILKARKVLVSPAGHDVHVDIVPCIRLHVPEITPTAVMGIG